MKIALVVIYNHRFDENIPKLDKIYGNRFSNIYHLVPFYDGNLPHVIPVYENSFYFQAYVAVAWSKLKSLGFNQFVFIGDDLILNPYIDEQNINAVLKLKNDDAFLPWYWGSFAEIPMEYPNFLPAWNAFYQKKHLKQHAINWQDLLPSYLEAKKVLEKNGFDTGKITRKNLKGYYHFYKYFYFKSRLKKYIQLLVLNQRLPPYPVVAGYSDFFVIPENDMEKCVQMMEVFRMMRLWVEFAVPTTLLLCCKNVVTEKDIEWEGQLPLEFYKSAERQNVDLNRPKLKKLFERIEQNDFSSLNDLFENNDLYIHPIKLSKINVKL
jgi:hypothetical protein